MRQLRFRNQPKSFGLFEIAPPIKGDIRLKVPLADNMFVCDALSRWENATKKDKDNFGRKLDAPLELRKKLFFLREQDEDYALADEDDMVADFLFSQVYEDFVSGQLPTPVSAVAKLAACLLQIRFRASDPGTAISSSVLADIVGTPLQERGATDHPRYRGGLRRVRRSSHQHREAFLLERGGISAILRLLFLPGQATRATQQCLVRGSL